MARTSDRVSSIAARYTDIRPDTLLALTATPESRSTLCAEIKSMAASCLRQDEVKGLRKLIRKVMG